MTAQCENCRYAKPLEDEDAPGKYRCQRYPPQIVRAAGTDEPICCYPEVYAGDWCGEYLARLS